ncbi:hypothetical protein SETIT_9G220900v2 [Setaria italica]|uniref:MATH domain-containing protein n=2 Tax=Setaria italica TaxID=4555 RepID=K4ACC9_SETIT|nr:uncharacterized protein LOC101758239 [Setaria italica]RCV42491.1 hypothetical protein SETIT_9G220900v2 [Setaria italica]
MGACASSSRGRPNQGKNQKSSKVAAVPSTPAAASPEMEEKSRFKWRIDGFSSLLDKQKGWTNSGYFEIKGLKWYLQLNLKDRKSGDTKDYVSLVLVLSKTSDLKPDIIVEASFKLLIYDQAYGKHKEHEVNHHFQTEESRKSRVSCMIPVETLKEPSSGFVIGDSCVFGVELIKLSTAKANHSSDKVQVIQKTNGFSAREAYTWVIDDFLALKGRCYSPEFEIGGLKWYLTMYPSGIDDSGEFASLYLHMAKPDASLQSSGVLVELSLSIKDQVTSNRNTMTGRCQFLATKEEGDGWGWAKFMAAKSVEDWYLVKGSCLIEADVAIVGSSKMA